MSVRAESVLFVSSRADIAGGEKYLLSVFRHLDRDRYVPIVVLPGEGSFKVELDALRIENLVMAANYGWLRPPQEWYPFLQALPSRVRALAELIRQRSVALVHTNSNQALEGALAARLCGVKHVYMAHIEFQSNLPIYQRFPLDAASFAQLMGDLSDGILAVSGQVRDSLCPPLTSERVKVVHNGLEMERYDSSLATQDGTLRASLSLPDDAVLVVAAGRVTEDKGFDLLIEAAVRLCPTHPSTVFLLCGAIESQEYYATLVRRIESAGLSQRVRFLGRRDDLPEVMAQSDVFVLPSRREGHPYVLLEAMACKLPTVATRCGGVDETVVEGETGFVVPVGDAAAIADRLAPLLAESALRARLGRAAGERVRAHFTAQQTAQGLFDMYERLLAQPAPRAGAYTVDLLLQAASEYGYLGARLTALEERVAKTERAADLVLENPAMRLLRHAFRR